jgi:hypothetical protein
MSMIANDLIELARMPRTAQSSLVLALLALNIIAPGVADAREGL